MGMDTILWLFRMLDSFKLLLPLLQSFGKTKSFPLIQTLRYIARYDILASRFKVQGDQLLCGQPVSGFSDQGTLFSPSNTALLDVSS